MASPADGPSWSSGSGASHDVQPDRATTIYYGLRYYNLLMGFMVALAAVFTFESVHRVDETSQMFIAFYSLMFGAILTGFELTRMFGVESLTMLYKRNLGFLFKPVSRAIYILFVAFLLFGLKAAPGGDANSNWLGYLVGLLMVCESLFIFVLKVRYPSLLLENNSK